MRVQIIEDDYIETALLRQCDKQAQAAILSQQSEHQRRS